jgi:phage terminase large subunit
LCAGLDDPEKLKSIYGITSVWLEEANEMTIDDFRQVNLRLRGQFSSYKQISISFNPISKLLWLYNEFFENKKHNATVMHSTYKDNLFLLKTDPEYVAELESYKEIDQTYYNIYTLGEWGQLLESIYNHYEFITDFPKENSFKDSCYGLDYGFNSPSALTFIGRRDEEYYIKELIYDTKLTHNQLIAEMARLIPLKARRERIIYVDSAEPELIKQLKSSGFIAKLSDKSVKDGINYCKSVKMYLDKESTNLCKEVPAYSYRKDKDGNVLEEPIKINDHLCDSFRYAMYTHWGKVRPRASLVFI